MNWDQIASIVCALAVPLAAFLGSEWRRSRMLHLLQEVEEGAYRLGYDDAYAEKSPRFNSLDVDTELLLGEKNPLHSTVFSST